MRNTLRSVSLTRRLKKIDQPIAIHRAKKTFQRTFPWLVTVEMMLSPSRLLLTRTTGF
jgi:hypothetical protein